jgi:cob(I)alamin adenosyltransferase
VGTLDELNAHLGLVKVKAPEEKDKKFLEAVQVNIHKMMSHISDTTNKDYFFTETETAVLKKESDNIKGKIPKLSELVFPGINETEALTHIARTVTRRAERYFTAVNEQTPLCRYAASYLNKLSEYLFYLSQSFRFISYN